MMDLSSMTPTPELVLLCFREGWATTSNEPVKTFGYRPDEFHIGRHLPRDAVLALERSKLISINDKQENFEHWSLSLDKELLFGIQIALGVRIKALATNPRDQRMLVSPMFGHARSVRKQYDVFVVMPSSEDLAPVYRDHIAAVLSSLSLTYEGADDFFSAREIILDVWSCIYHAELVIADCTSKNPNVFYELGLAHAIGKPVILISGRSSDVPFDIGHIRHIANESIPRGMKQFERRLRATIEELKQNPMTGLRKTPYGRSK